MPKRPSDERWRPIEGFPAYEVSERGRVRRIVADLKATLGRTGYPRVTLYDSSGRMWTRNVHSLVCAAFNGKPAPDQIVCHRDGSRTNNKATNLYWGTHKDNAADRQRHELGRIVGDGKTPAQIYRMARAKKISVSQALRAVREITK